MKVFPLIALAMIMPFSAEAQGGCSMFNGHRVCPPGPRRTPDPTGSPLTLGSGPPPATTSHTPLVNSAPLVRCRVHGRALQCPTPPG